jgi:hypothetical protein
VLTVRNHLRLGTDSCSHGVFLIFVYLSYRESVYAILFPYDFDICSHCDPLHGQVVTPSETSTSASGRRDSRLDLVAYPVPVPVSFLGRDDAIPPRELIIPRPYWRYCPDDVPL